MATDGGFCYKCGKHHICSCQDAADALQYALKHIESKKQKLLVIELENETSVPKVFYKGEEIKCKNQVSFDWDTDTDIFGGLSYAIEHTEMGNKFPTINRIERRVKGHATD